eukprot:scaffold4522_cov36-Phaeocystis_antarctica.AAC.1
MSWYASRLRICSSSVCGDCASSAAGSAVTQERTCASKAGSELKPATLVAPPPTPPTSTSATAARTMGTAACSSAMPRSCRASSSLLRPPPPG